MKMDEIYSELEVDDKVLSYEEDEIIVKQYLPLRDKLKLVINIVEGSFTDTGYKGLLSYISYNVNMIDAYTDIEMDSDLSYFEVLDFLDESGLTEKILKLIPETEKDFIERVLLEDLEERKKKEDSLISNLGKAFRDLSSEVNSLDDDLINKMKKIMSSGASE